MSLHKIISLSEEEIELSEADNCKMITRSETLENDATQTIAQRLREFILNATSEQIKTELPKLTEKITEEELKNLKEGLTQEFVDSPPISRAYIVETLMCYAKDIIEKQIPGHVQHIINSRLRTLSREDSRL